MADANDLIETGSQYQTTRRGFLRKVGEATAVGAAATLGGGVLLHLAVDAETRDKQEKTLEFSTGDFLTKWDERETVGMGFHDWALQPENMDRVEQERELVRDLVHEGVSLSAQWSNIGKGQNAEFDLRHRLFLEGRSFRVSENDRDLHLALNILRTKLALLVEKDPEERMLLQEDHDDLLFLADVNAEIVIESNAWSLMPRDWALAFARFYRWLDRTKLPFPTKCQVTPRKSMLGNRGGFYEGGAIAPFPGYQCGEAGICSGQIIVLYSGNGASSIHHEGAHYVADHQETRKRMIGPQSQITPEHYQAQFNRITGDEYRSILNNYFKERGSIGNMLESFVTDYAVTNPQEDFADTLEKLVMFGPFYRAGLNKLRERNPQAAQVLEAKLNFFQKLVGEFSFEGRRKRSEITSWEKKKLDSMTEEKPYFLQGSLLNRTDFLNGQLTMLPWAKGAIFSTSWTTNLGWQLVLQQPQIWQEHMKPVGVEETWTSTVYPVPHFEISGKMKIQLPMIRQLSGQEVEVDTENEASIRKLIGLLPLVDVARLPFYRPLNIVPTTFSPETVRKMADLGTGVPRFITYGWQSRPVPPTFIDNDDLVYMHFQQQGGKWLQAPIETVDLTVHQKIGEGKEKGSVVSQSMTPMLVGDQDIILGIDYQGQVKELVLVNYVGILPQGSVPPPMPQPR